MTHHVAAAVGDDETGACPLCRSRPGRAEDAIGDVGTDKGDTGRIEDGAELVGGGRVEGDRGVLEEGGGKEPSVTGLGDVVRVGDGEAFVQGPASLVAEDMGELV